MSQRQVGFYVIPCRKKFIKVLPYKTAITKQQARIHQGVIISQASTQILDVLII